MSAETGSETKIILKFPDQTLKYFTPFLLTIASLTKHDRYVEQLCHTLSPQYDQVLSHVVLFSSKQRRVAEIDVLGIKENVCDAYEVKCSYRPMKARKQLLRIRKVLSSIKKIKNTYFYCGDAGLLERV